MKQQKTFIVLRDKKTGYFLSDYKNRTGRLAYEASWVECVNDALIIPEDHLINVDDINKEKFLRSLVEGIFGGE